MSHRVILKLVGVLLTIAAASPAVACGPGEAAGAHRPAPSTKAFPKGTDFVVLVWYRRNDPLGTFEHQFYDVRKGEYTSAVDDWLKVMRTKHPDYLVVVRRVDLSRERGETEKLKVGSVIYRELMIAAAQSGVVLGAPVNISPGPYTGQNQTPSSYRMPVPDRSFLNPGATRYPINVYPRTRPP
jgi:hypothetical protein